VGDDVALRDHWHVPLESRLSPKHAQYAEIVRRHSDALSQGVPNYPDPLSGFRVFTAEFLARRGYCCASGCRHCPFVSSR
jgi:hypothetical protein